MTTRSGLWPLVMAFVFLCSIAPMMAATAPQIGSVDPMILGTRGFARTSADRNNVDKEAETLFRIEFPYGASAGWKICYQGYSDGTKSDVILLGVGVWEQQAPGKSLVRKRVTFAGGNTVTIPHDILQESDGISDALLPGAVVWVTQWYKCSSPTDGLPYQTIMYNRELAGPGTESQDGALVGPVGSLTDHTLTGGFDHSAYGEPLTAGVGYVIRGYQPMCVTGTPSPSYRGSRIAPIFIGDSINVMQIDCGPNDNTIFFTRGFGGRFCKDKYPFLIFGQSGSGSGGFTSLVSSPLFAYVFGAPGTTAAKITHLVNEYGINEIRSSGSGQATWNNRLAVAAICHTYGIPYIQTTLTPCGANNLVGTAKDNGYPAFVAQRKIFNDLVRSQSDNTHIPGCVGFIDPCTLLETDSVNSNNVWAPDCGGDIHPNSTGHQKYADTIPARLFEMHAVGQGR